MVKFIKFGLFGLGGGLNFGDFISVEAEYTRFELSNDADLEVDMFLVGANIKF